jgi:hypothetical protein
MIMQGVHAQSEELRIMREQVEHEQLINNKRNELRELEQQKNVLLQDHRAKLAQATQDFNERTEEQQRNVRKLQQLAAASQRGNTPDAFRDRQNVERANERLEAIEEEELAYRQTRISEWTHETAQIDSRIRVLQQEIDTLTRDSEGRARHLEGFSLDSSSMGTIKTTAAKLYKQEQALAKIDETLIRLKALEAIRSISEEVKAEAQSIIQRSRLEDPEKQHLLYELEHPLSAEQQVELTRLNKERREITLFQIRTAHANIKSLLKDRERAIQELVAPTQSTWEHWWSGSYDKDNIADEGLKGDISFLEQEVELGKALRKVGYNATKAMNKFPELFNIDQEDEFFDIEPPTVAPKPEAVEPGRMAQLALWGSRIKRWGTAAGRFAQQLLTPSDPEKDIVKIVAHAQQELRDREHRELEYERQEEEEREARWESVRQEGAES